MSVFLLLHGGLPGCHRLGAIGCLTPRQGWAPSWPNPQGNGQASSPSPNTWGLLLEMKTIVKPLNFGVQAKATVEAARGD